MLLSESTSNNDNTIIKRKSQSSVENITIFDFHGIKKKKKNAFINGIKVRRVVNTN